MSEFTFGYNFVESGIDGNGEQYYTFLLEPEQLNEDGLISGVRGVDITLNHKAQRSTVSTFTWQKGMPCNWNVIKVLKGEIIGKPEIPALMKKLGIEVEGETK